MEKLYSIVAAISFDQPHESNQIHRIALSRMKWMSSGNWMFQLWRELKATKTPHLQHMPIRLVHLHGQSNSSGYKQGKNRGNDYFVVYFSLSSAIALIAYAYRADRCICSELCWLIESFRPFEAFSFIHFFHCVSDASQLNAEMDVDSSVRVGEKAHDILRIDLIDPDENSDDIFHSYSCFGPWSTWLMNHK